MPQQLIVSMVGPEKQGLVNELSKKTRELGGSWLVSKLIHLDGQMAGLFKLEIAEGQLETVKEMMTGYSDFNVQYHASEEASTVHEQVAMTVEGEDRSGLTRDITRLLYDNDVKVEQFSSQRYAVTGLSTSVFEAKLNLSLPTCLTVEELKQQLEELAGRIRVEVVS